MNTLDRVSNRAETHAHQGLEPNRRFAIAPMMDWTDRFYRAFARGLSRNTLLYTEMITTGALLHGDRERFLRYAPEEHPLALQLGGSDPQALAQCARFAETAGYAEVNLNVGCPSDRVQNNMIGACLMAHPALVGDCVAAMRDATSLPITVKHRIGINGRDSYAELCDFVGHIRQRGCQTFIAHARIAILEGLSPKQNRDVPPLNYPWVYQLKRDFPDLEIIINGGIIDPADWATHLQHVDGIMVGREAYQNPWILASVDPLLFGADAPVQNRQQALEAFIPVIEQHLAEGVPLKHMTRHILGLFHGCPGGRLFRRHLSENAHGIGAGIAVLQEAMSKIAQPSAESLTSIA